MRMYEIELHILHFSADVRDIKVASIRKWSIFSFCLKTGKNSQLAWLELGLHQTL